MANHYEAPSITPIGTLHQLTSQAPPGLPPGKVFGPADGTTLNDANGNVIATAGSA